MDEKELQTSLSEYRIQLNQVKEALENTKNANEINSLLSLQEDLQQLIQLTQESLNSICKQNEEPSPSEKSYNKTDLDDEYALFMEEMAKTGAIEKDNNAEPSSSKPENCSDDDDIEDELSTLLGMKCAVYYSNEWGGQPTLHNAMVSAVVPKQLNDGFEDLQVQVLFTHPTQAAMVPCPFFLDGDCKFNDEQCRYSHGMVVQLSSLKEAIEPNFNSIKIDSKVLVKLKPPDDDDITLTRKAAEKYYLWYRGSVKKVNLDQKTCLVKLDNSIRSGEKRKSSSDEHNIAFENLFPLNDDDDNAIDSDGSLSDTEYPDLKTFKSDDNKNTLLIEKSLHDCGSALGEWEKHTRGIGSKLMLAMGYVPGTGLGASSDGRLQPVEARVLPVGKSLDHCMEISEKMAGQDPLKLELKLKRIKKREEERNKRAYEREKEKERRNVFNFLNRTLGDKSEDQDTSPNIFSSDIKSSTNKDLNIEKFKITEDVKRVERELNKLKNTLGKHAELTNGYKNIIAQISDKKKELNILKNKEKLITKELTQRKDKKEMTVF
ncbi:Zinc finger CCCH-type with G patch domain-containing protein [Eumeta japonica]|uniref:Zinc finger CCCH-type with G patch domain-containing protein n=1 Tax=Eumeta variegata TaxID=151549 RepID=A0A4C1XX99_EUMVA|nr:Zinc finger CCCH-type with G patch domain-containing protein [Eumeta japonica]